MVAMISGWVRDSRSLLPWRSVGHVGEALAAVARLGGPVPLDGRAHGPVEDHDPLPEQRGELVGGVRPELDTEFV